MSLLDKLLDRKPEDPNETFWKWFQANSHELRKVTTCKEKICDMLLKQLHKTHKDLTFAFGSEKDSRREFVISADGNRDAFQAVQTLARTSPYMAGWKIVAFRPAVGWDAVVKFDEISIGADDVWFKSELNDIKIDVILYLKRHLLEINKESVMQAVFLLLDYGLGEYVIETRIGNLDLQPLPDEPLPPHIKPLPELTTVTNKLIT
ncbi:MAG: hypothetical protein ACYC0V_16240 [Armatimonadota bacterium]